MDKLPRGRKRGTHLNNRAWREEPAPAQPAVFRSLFTNAWGERWFANVDSQGRLHVWGDAIDCQYVYDGLPVNHTAPILLGSDEQEWLGAMLEHTRVLNRINPPKKVDTKCCAG